MTSMTTGVRTSIQTVKLLAPGGTLRMAFNALAEGAVPRAQVLDRQHQSPAIGQPRAPPVKPRTIASALWRSMPR